MFTDDNIDWISGAAERRAPKEKRDEYRERLCTVAWNYSIARQLEGRPLSHLARELGPIERSSANSQSRVSASDDIQRLLTAQARGAGYQGAVDAATTAQLATWAQAARKRLDARVAHRKRHGQVPHKGDQAIGTLIGDLFGLYLDIFAGEQYPVRGPDSPAVRFIQRAGATLSTLLDDDERLADISFDLIRRRIPSAKKITPASQH